MIESPLGHVGYLDTCISTSKKATFNTNVIQTTGCVQELDKPTFIHFLASSLAAPRYVHVIAALTNGL